VVRKTAFSEDALATWCKHGRSPGVFSMELIASELSRRVRGMPPTFFRRWLRWHQALEGVVSRAECSFGTDTVVETAAVFQSLALGAFWEARDRLTAPSSGDETFDFTIRTQRPSRTSSTSRYGRSGRPGSAIWNSRRFER
jgi:hypothetical protein